MTPIFVGETSAHLLGPLIVEPVFRSRGIGEALVNASLEAARAAGGRLAILVGDEPYYARMGFPPARAPGKQVVLPGPVDPAPVLVCELAAGSVQRRAGQDARGVNPRRRLAAFPGSARLRLMPRKPASGFFPRAEHARLGAEIAEHDRRYHRRGRADDLRRRL